MLKKMRILCVFTVVIALVLCSMSTFAEPINIDAFLINAGFPENLVTEMSTIQKEMIYEHSVGKNIEFCGYAEKEFVITDEGALEERTNVSPRGGVISPADMTLSVWGTRVYSTAGRVFYTVYPSFAWHTYKMVANDSFAMNMYPGWEAIPGERNFRLHILNNQGQTAQYVDLAPTQSSSTGYSYKIPSTVGFMQGLYEGYAYYDLDKVSSTASPRISLYYAHDTTSSFNLSYSLNVGPAGISLAGDVDKVYTMSDNFEVSGMDQ